MATGRHDIVSASDVVALAGNVNDRIRERWQSLSPPFTRSDSILQALVIWQNESARPLKAEMCPGDSE